MLLLEIGHFGRVMSDFRRNILGLVLAAVSHRVKPLSSSIFAHEVSAGQKQNACDGCHYNRALHVVVISIIARGGPVLNYPLGKKDLFWPLVESREITKTRLAIAGPGAVIGNASSPWQGLDID